MESFLTSINSFIKTAPDIKHKDLPEVIRPKCHVVYYPIEIPEQFVCEETNNNWTHNNTTILLL